MEREDRFYFVGLMVFMRSDEKLRVLDGQQRLATTIILLAAIRSWFASNLPGDDVFHDLQRDFIGRKELGGDTPIPRLTLNFNNDDRFQRYVVSASPLADIRREHAATNRNAPNHPMLSAILFMHDKVASIATTHGDAETTKKYLIDLAKYIRDNVIVVRLTVPDEANAFRVFETLNDRSLDLSAVDLLKNHLFGLAHDHSAGMLTEIERRWSQITQTLTDFKEEDFLKVFWTSRYGRTQLDDLFDDFKRRYNTGTGARELSLDLLEAAEQYAALEVSDDVIWSTHLPKTRKYVGSLKILDSKQVKPIMLSALKKFTPTEMERLLRLLEVVIVRYQLIGEGRTGALEISCAKLAQEIWMGSVTSATEAVASLNSVLPTDEAFRAAFHRKGDIAVRKALYLLRRIEEQERRDNRPATAGELAPTPVNLSIEHILPRNPGPAWDDVIASDLNVVDDCAHRIGNFCLLTEGSNRGLGRASFDDKKAVYNNSELLTTKYIGGHPSSWNRIAIQQRQEWLTARALSVWRFQ